MGKVSGVLGKFILKNLMKDGLRSIFRKEADLKIKKAYLMKNSLDIQSP